MTKTENRVNSVTKSLKNIAQKNLVVRVTDKDFSEALTVTRTLFKDVVTKTSIVESTLACAAASSDVFTVSKLASFIVNNFKVNDCFHKRETNKANDVMKSTILRIRHHVKDTIKTNHIADKLYSYDKTSDCVSFSAEYQKVCKTDAEYRKHVTAFLKRMKAQYHTNVKNAVEKKKLTQKAEKLTTKYSKKQIKAFNLTRIMHDSDVCRMQAQALDCEYSTSKAA